ncbi:LysR family transcriptional regulator, partial [bacterium]|nr:LysR family transcriptional regulator [bacterium]
MRKYIDQGTPKIEHPVVGEIETLNWENIRIFLAVGHYGSIRAASSKLGMALNTVRRHIELLERESSCLLFVRNTKGIELTEDGSRILLAAKKMEHASLAVKQAIRSESSGFEGHVRLSITEGIGTFWVMPKLVEFQRAHPKIIIDINATMRQSDLLRMDADIAIQLTRPTNPDLKIVKLGRMHVMPFASKEYLNLYGRPKSLDDVVNHKIVEQLSPQLDIDAVDRLFPDIP